MGIMTSNVGAKIIEKESGIQSRKSTSSSLDINSDFLSYSSDPVMDPNVYKRISFLVNEELKKYFRPEFLNRLDEIIVFSHLTRQDIIQLLEDNLASEFLAKPLYPKTKLIVDVDLENKIIVNINYDHVDPKLLPEDKAIE